MSTSLQPLAKFIFRTFTAICLLVIFGINTIAATFTSTGGTSAAPLNWSSPSSWTVSGGTPASTIPSAADEVRILLNHAISVTSPGVISNLNVVGSLLVNIPNGTLQTTNLTQNTTNTIGTIDVTSGNLRVENNFYLTKMQITINGSSSSVTFGGTRDFDRTTEYFRVNNGGKLIMENIGKGAPPKRQYKNDIDLGDILFPIGTTNGTAYSYTPIYINNRDNRSATKNATFAVTVTHGIYSNGTDGFPLASNAVNKTWSVAVLYGDAEAEIYVKWNQSNELPNFSATNSLIALYQDGGWDQYPPTYLVPASRVSSIAGPTSLTNIVTGQTSQPKVFPLISIHGNGLNPLPVELTFFNAVKRNAEVALTWETASERNCKGFEIQTSTDGKKYEALAFVNSANGNSTSLQRYAYNHKTGNREGVVYYRLKQLDLDGTVSYYPAKVVDLGHITYTASIYPNPFQESFKLQLQTSEAGQAEVRVKDITGRTIVHNQPVLVKGSNTLELNLQDAPAGVYLMSVSIGKENYTNRIVKQ